MQACAAGKMEDLRAHKHKRRTNPKRDLSTMEGSIARVFYLCKRIRDEKREETLSGFPSRILAGRWIIRWRTLH